MAKLLRLTQAAALEVSFTHSQTAIRVDEAIKNAKEGIDASRRLRALDISSEKLSGYFMSRTKTD